MSGKIKGRAPNEWWVGVVAGMASYIDSAALVGTGIALTIYQLSIGVTASQLGVMSGALTLSVAIGALVGGRLGDRFGRRRVFLTTMVLIAVGSALATFGSAFAVLLPGVILIGLGVGADLPVSLASISEAASNRNRGKLILLSGMLWLVGMIASISIASFTGDLGRLGGQLLFGQVGVVALIVLAGRLTIPESAVWLEATRKRAAGEVDVTAKARVRDLLRAPYLAPFAVLLVFYTLTNIGANTTGSFNTFIATNYAGASVEQFNQWALIVMIISLLPGLLFMRFVDTKKRMVFFTIGAVLSTFAYLFVAIVGISLMSIVGALLLASVGNAFAFEGIMKVWTQESFPTMLRSTAQGTIIAAARVVAALLATITPALLQANIYGVYISLAVIVGVGFAVGGLYFRRSRRSEFAAEGASPAVADDIDVPAVGPNPAAAPPSDVASADEQHQRIAS